MGGVDQADEVADFALGAGRADGAGVEGKHGDLEGGGMEPGVVERDRHAGECGERVVGAAGVGARRIGHIGELRGVGQDVGAGNAADPEKLGSQRCEGTWGQRMRMIAGARVRAG